MNLHGSGAKVTEEDLLNFENQIKGKLSEEYKAFLLSTNGGYLDDFLVTPDFVEIIDGEEFTQSINPDKFYDLSEVIEEYEVNLEDEVIHKGYIPIAYDSSGNLILLVAEIGEDNGKIFFANHEEQDDDGIFILSKLADSFDEFIESLYPFEE